MCPASGKEPKCFNCGNTKMILTNFKNTDIGNASATDTEEKFLQMLRERYTINSDVFDKDLYQKLLDEEYADRMALKAERRRREQHKQQQSQSQPQIKCPTCGSTNVQKIGSGERAASIFGFGLFSRKARKTFKCNSCGYMW